MANLRFSNQGPIVLGLGGAYPSYASIPNVYGGPGNSILISVYNRGGSYVPNTIYNLNIPTTIGTNNPVDFSDYYTTTNYNPASGDPIPDIPNPRPTNGNIPPTAVVIAQITPAQSAYIGNTVSMGSLITKNGPQGTFTCSSVTIDGITVSNIATNPQNIQFVVQGNMNYDADNRSTVYINSPELSYPLSVPNYFARYPINYSLYGTISATAAEAGQQVQISNLLSLQTTATISVTIGGVPQTILNIIPHDLIQNDILLSISEDTPTVDSDIVITNAKGDSVTLPQKFRRATNEDPLNPADRGGPPSINWTAGDNTKESLVFNLSSDLQIGASSTFVTTQPGNAPPKGLRNATTAALDPDPNFHGNQSPNLNYSSEFSFRETGTGTTFVAVATVAADVIVPPQPLSGSQIIEISMTWTPVAYNYNLTTNGAGTGSYSRTLNAYFERPTAPLASRYSDSGSVPAKGMTWFTKTDISWNSSTGITTETVRVNTSMVTTESTLIITAGTTIYLNLGVDQYYVTKNYSATFPDGSTVTIEAGKYYVTTRNGTPVKYGQSLICKSYYLGNDVYYLYGFSPTGYVGQFSFYDIVANKLGVAGNTPQYVRFSTTPATTVRIMEVIRSDENSGLSPYTNLFYLYNCYINNTYYVSLVYGLLAIHPNSTEFITYPPSNPYLGAGNPRVNNYETPVARFYNWGSTVVFIGNYFIYDLNTLTFTITIDDPAVTRPYTIDVLITDTKLLLTVKENYYVITDPVKNYLYYLDNGSTTQNKVLGFTYGTNPLVPEYVNQNNDNTYTIVLGQYNVRTLQYYVSTLAQGSNLAPAPVAYWSFIRPVSTTYTALNLNLVLQPNELNSDRAQAIADVLTANWNGPAATSYTITTDNSNNTILMFDTGSTSFSGSTLTLYAGNPTSGSLTMTTTGGSSGPNAISRLQIPGATLGGPVYVDSSYGYINNLTFTHSTAAFDYTSAVIGNAYQPSSIKDILIIN